MEVFGIRLVGVNAAVGHKLLLTLALLLLLLALRAIVVWAVRTVTGEHPNQRVVFWTRQGASVLAAVLLVVGVLSIWFEDPRQLTTGLGIFGAGLAFALQRVVTALAGYVVVLRGNTFTVGDRIFMGGVRGDVIALSFMQTKIMEMGQPPGEQGDNPSMWVRSRQFTGRIVTVTNDKVFDEPVYNYTREFPFIWDEVRLPLSYRADRGRAERILLEAVALSAGKLDVQSEPVRRALERRYFMSLDDLTPRVYWRLTDNWLEMTVRFIVHDHGSREVKDAITREVLRRLDEADIPVASATFEVVGVPTLHVRQENR